MEILEAQEGPVAVLRPVGRLDSNSCRELEDRLMPMVEVDGAAIVLDFADLDYVSSAGLRVLLMAAKRARATNARIALSALQQQVRTVFDISGFTALFEIHPSSREAAAAIA